MVRFGFAFLIVSILSAMLFLDPARAAPVQNNYSTYFMPDMFSIDRIPFSCGTVIFELDSKLPVAGVNRGNGHIVLNPDILESMPTALKLFIADHECAYTVVGRKDETAALCWAVRDGRDEGWYPPPTFAMLTRLLRQSPEPGWPPRLTVKQIQAMKKCYAK